MMLRLRTWTSYWKIRTSKYRHAWRVSSFIIGVVISNSLAEYAIVGSLMTYISESLDKPVVVAAAVINIKEGFTSFMAITGSFIADAYHSRFFVVLVSVALYIYGLLLFTLSVHYGEPLLYPALVLIAMGEGGQEHTLRKFGADQFEEHIKDKYKAKSHSRAWSYMGSLVGSVAGMALVTFSTAIDEEDINKIWIRLGCYSIIFMLVAFLVLVLGSLSYYRDVTCGSPFTPMLRVVVAAARKRRLDWPADDRQIHDGRNPGCTINMSDGGEEYNIYGTMDKHGVDGKPNMTDHSKRDKHSNSKGDKHLHSGNSKENRCLEDMEIMGGLVDDELILRTYVDRNSHTEDNDAHLSLPNETYSLDLKDGYISPNYADDEHLRPCFDRDGHTGDDDGCLPHHENHSVDLEDGKHPPNYANEETHWLPHTNGLRCLDKASIIEKPGANEESKWRLCTQTEVEETKLFLRLFPVWVTFLTYGIVLSMGKTTFMEQASNLDAKIGNFNVPVTFLLVFGGISKVAVTKACNCLTKPEHEIPPKVRIGAGLFLSALCCLTASLVEKKRLNVLMPDSNTLSWMSIFWLIPQFWLLGAMEGLVGDGIEDLFVSQVPETMWKCGPAFSESVEGMGSILSAIFVVLTDQLSQVGGWRHWFQHEIDDSHLDWYYLTFAVGSLINLCLYAFVAKAYLWQGTGNRHKRETDRGAVACLEMIADIVNCGD